MTLGITKSYTPSAGQIGNSTGYNTDIAALFNAFANLETQTASLGGLTVTPTANSTTTLKVTNAAGTSIFSVDTTNSLVKFKTASIVAQNIATTRLTDDFSATVGSWTARTGGYVSLTTVKASAKVLVMVSSNWGAAGTEVKMRINRDSGTAYVYLRIFYNTAAMGTIWVGGTTLFSGLTAATHTFSVDVYGTTGTINNNCTTDSGEQRTFEIIAMEI